ncbi:hypothetical protein AAEU33_14525 [Chryseobacterium sp. Chry.R1]|uniref:hypothetical protein n=1 Tax=Chryseobacterium sp. Chry.R1 TaxID=3139392 RepID=UPI0031FA3333
MRNILLSYILLLLIGCTKKENYKKVFSPDNRLKQMYTTKGDIITIYDYAKDGKLMMKLKFKQDQFIDTIYYYDQKQHYITIDSSKGKYFYGTHVLFLDNGKLGYKGPLRFKKNISPQIAFKSLLRFGRHTGYNEDESINDDLIFKIIGDSSYVNKTIIRNKKKF